MVVAATVIPATDSREDKDMGATIAIPVGERGKGRARRNEMKRPAILLILWALSLHINIRTHHDF